MGDWYRVIKETGPGRKYLYLQRTHRVRGKKNPVPENQSLGRWNPNPVPRKRRRFDAAAYEENKGSLALAIFGREDEYGRLRDSLYNRAFHKDELEARWAEENPQPEPEKAPKFYDQPPEPKNDEAAPQSEAAKEGSGAGNSDEASE